MKVSYAILTHNEDKELKKLGRDHANILQRNRKVKPIVTKRAKIKHKINDILGSNIKESKSHE